MSTAATVSAGDSSILGDTSLARGVGLAAMRIRISFVVIALVLFSCGGSTSEPDEVTAAGAEGGGSGGSIASPCDLADAAQVGTFFSGTVADGAEGVARNCTFQITDGDVTTVDVFYFGEASGWDGTRSGYESNRGGVTDVDGIGDEAFYPNDMGERELVVQAGGEIFVITVFAGLDEPPAAAIESVAGLAGFIADDLG